MSASANAISERNDVDNGLLTVTPTDESSRDVSPPIDRRRDRDGRSDPQPGAVSAKVDHERGAPTTVLESKRAAAGDGSPPGSAAVDGRRNVAA